MKALPPVRVDPEIITFNGGLDVVSPPLRIPPGMLREAQNFEQDIQGGYTRIVGYERYSGKAKPSDAAYAVLAVTITGTIAVGNVLQDNATTSFGTVIAIATDNTYVVLTLMTGHFSAGNVKVGGVTQGTCTGIEITDGASTPLLHAQYRNLAADVYRALIAAVPGQGAIRGVWLYNDVIYAFRDAAGGLTTAMYKATASGWSLVPLGEEISFTNATTTAIEGATLTQGGVTATLTRIVVQTGSLASGVNTGRFIFATHAGGNFAAGPATAGAGAATLGGAQTAITFAVPSGRFEFVNNNFGGSANTKRMYGVDGKNRGFEFDGTVFVPIATGMNSDAPLHVTAHRNHLFFSFGGSVQHSAPGQPYVWSVVLGAAELAMGDTVAGFMPQPSGATEAAMAIFTRNNLSILYGTGVANWILTPFDRQAGGYAYSIQHIGITLMLDDRGLTSMQTTKNYGNFASATLSARVQTWLKTRRTLVTSSCLARDKNQYRVFFSDGSALFLTHNDGRVVGLMPQLFANPVQVIVSEEMNDGTEVSFMGSTDGFIYQMEKGTSFDGGNIEAFLTLAFNHSGTPRTEKDYRHATFEITGEGYFEFSFSYELGYASTEIEQPSSVSIASSFAATRWDSFVWDAFYWDGVNLMPGEATIDGTANNISLRIRSNSDYYAAARFSGAILQYTPRVPLR